MKTLLIVAVLVVCAWQNSAAQEIRLDSLWDRYGGVETIVFSPDSKTLMIGETSQFGGGTGTIRFFDPMTGQEKGAIENTRYFVADYTPDGSSIITGGTDFTVKLYDAKTLEVRKSIPCPDIGTMSFSPDGNIVALASSKYIAIVDLSLDTLLIALERPEDYKVSINQTAPYWNGMVSFSPDGQYIIGKYENKLVRWNWKNTPTVPEIIISDIPNLAIIGFSPDKKYFVQQSNFIWDLIEKKQIKIEGINAVYNQANNGVEFSRDNKYLFCVSEKLQLNIVSLEQKKVLYNTEKGAAEMAVSNDNQFLSYLGVGNKVRTYHITWDAVSVHSEEENTIPLILIKPQPGNEFITIEIETPKSYTDCKISVMSSLGAVVGNVYQGDIINGKRTFIFPTTGLSSGQYTLFLSYKTGTISTSFIITK